MSNNKKGIFLIFALFGIMSVSVLGTEAPSKSITLDYYGTVTEIETKVNTLEDFLDSEDIEIKDTDTLNINLDKVLDDNDEIIITKGVTINLIIDGKEEIYTTKADSTIGNVVGSYIDETSIRHVYAGSYNEPLVDDENYELSTIRDEVERTIEIVPFEIEYIEVEHLDPLVEEIIVYGLDGTNEIIHTKSMYGTDVVEETTESIVLIEPTTQVVNIGAENKISTEEGFLPYSEVLYMNASAYTPGFESTGKNPGDAGYGKTATGAIATKGIVAVDPRVIPLGTKLYIENYGIAIAADTGGAIKGNKIDLCYESVNEALSFGRRNINVYVLK